MSRRSILCLAGLPLLVSSAARGAVPTFLGERIQLEYGAQDVVGPFEQYAAPTVARAAEEVDSPVEFPAFAPAGVTFDVDVDANTITIDHFRQDVYDGDTFSAVHFFGLIFTDVFHEIPKIETVALLPSPVTMQGLDPEWTDDTITLNWQDLKFNDDTRIDLLVTFAENPIPEPALLVTHGLFALLLVARRRNRSTIAA